MNWLWYILSGLCAGVAAGMGMGGGTLLIPVLTLALGLPQHAAQGVNVLAFLPAAVAALVIHAKAGRLHLRACLPIIFAGRWALSPHPSLRAGLTHHGSGGCRRIFNLLACLRAFGKG